MACERDGSAAQLEQQEASGGRTLAGLVDSAIAVIVRKGAALVAGAGDDRLDLGDGVEPIRQARSLPVLARGDLQPLGGREWRPALRGTRAGYRARHVGGRGGM